MDNEPKIFPATLARTEKLTTHLVGFGVGIGVPTVLGLSFALGFQEPGLLLFPLPFVLAFGAPYFFRPLGFAVANEGITILRPLGTGYNRAFWLDRGSSRDDEPLYAAVWAGGSVNFSGRWARNSERCRQLRAITGR